MANARGSSDPGRLLAWAGGAVTAPGAAIPAETREGSIDRAAAKRQGENRFQRTFKDCEAVAKPELGTKRLCAHCGAKFYDLNHSPINCPKCGTVFEAVVVTSRGRPEAGRLILPVP